MSFGRNNFFDDNRGRGFRGYDNESPFGNYSNAGSNFDNIRRQRSPIFNDRDHFDSMSSNNFPSFSSRNTNFGYHPQQNQEQSSQNDSSSKVFHVPIHIEKDNVDQSNSYIKMNDQSNQPNQQFNQQQTNFVPNNQSSYYIPQQVETNYPSDDLSNHNLNNLKDRAEHEFKRQQDYLKNKMNNQQYSSQQQSNPQHQQSEYKIPIHIERDESNESSNLVRDFNKMHCPSSVRTSKPGQKHSTQANEFFNTKDFINTPSPSQHQQSTQNQQNFTQQSNEEQKPTQPQQQPKKPTDPMDIIQSILEEVEKYEHEIDNFSGEYQDKQYRYLDEYLTRCMLKLDTIDTNGDPNLKQARKNAIHYINKVISKLEKTETQNDDKKEHDNKEVAETDDKIVCDTKEENELNSDDKKELIVINESKESKEDTKDDKKLLSDNKEKKEDKKSEKKKTSKSDNKEKKKIKKDDG